MGSHVYSLNRRRALWLMGGLAGGWALHGCTQSSSTSSSPTEPLISGVNPWPGYSGHYVALAKDLFKAEGIPVQEVFFQSASESITSFLAGKVDVAWLTSGDAIQAAEKDPTIRMIYVVDYSNGSDGIMGREIKSPADLKGKTIARENILFENVLLRAYLAQGGLTEADVVLKDMTAGDAAAAFAAKRVDAAVSYEPWLTKSAKEGGGEVIFSTKDTNLIADVIATRQSIIETRKADLQAYLRAVDQGVKLVNAGDAEAIKITADKMGVSEAEAKEQIAGVKIFDIAMNKDLGFNLSDPNNILKNFDLTLKTGAEMKVISDGMKPEDLYDDSIVKSL
ncbi:MAG: ABC transporter substrate-binding protein [Pegethrix bostrychoides GSE-TBD4-15B]|jgi:NitT/TauT family transport system substrate-binding protein|uniref:ABC transporter substrate-binding protein n=1 Tax=Pegethrix bostrychoides GSE-TBD4-15B TaxID=2839662 RepID=A0A951U425_9CYAN|nr:ABC transporter substrate-binding protein [Pegethrix bostrychoides GSE-TBD4-15B]